MNPPLPVGRSDRNNFRNSRRGGDSGGVDHRGNQRRGPPRNVDANPVERLELLAERHSGTRTEPPPGRHRPAGKRLNLLQRGGDGPFFSFAEQGFRLVDFGVGDPEVFRRQSYVIELFGKLHQRGVSIAPDLVDDRRRLRLNLWRIAGPVVKRLERSLEAGLVRINLFHFFTSMRMLSISRVVPK